MRGIATALWNYPTVFAGSLQAGNAVLAGTGILPAPVAAGVAVVVAIANFAAVTPAKPR